ncbi:MAG TPA: nucleoside hydrolase [Rubrobacter sp.]|jgi:purine nucleosidase
MSGPVLVDTDPGIDDALALHYLVATGGWDLKAITAVAGNVPLPRAVANARGLAALLGIERDVPVYGGCPKPLMRDLETAQHVHGDDGMAGVVLPWPSVAERREHAVQVINELGRRYSGELTIVAIGPLTNVAAALILDPSLAQRVGRLVFMGGAVNVPGNMPPGVAEFNIYVDPEAARIVVESGMPFTMVGLDATEQSILSRKQLENLDDASTQSGFAREILDHYLALYERSRGGEACALHDPLAVAVAADPSWVKLETGNLYVETQGEYTRGKTAFLSQALREKSPGLDPHLALGQVALGLAREDFSGHFVATLDAQATL